MTPAYRAAIQTGCTCYFNILSPDAVNRVYVGLRSVHINSPSRWCLLP